MRALDDQSDDDFGDFIDWDDAQQDLKEIAHANGISHDDVDPLLKDA